LGKFLSAVRIRRQEPARIEALVRAVIRGFGGMEGLVREWWEWHQEASEAKKHHLTLRSFLATLYLIEAAAVLQAQRQPDVSQMDEGELSEFMDSHLRKMIRRNPAIAVKAAVEMGWEVTPPLNVLDDEHQEGAEE
jgi:hypothetical protein